MKQKKKFDTMMKKQTNRQQKETQFNKVVDLYRKHSKVLTEADKTKLINTLQPRTDQSPYSTYDLIKELDYAINNNKGLNPLYAMPGGRKTRRQNKKRKTRRSKV